MTELQDPGPSRWRLPDFSRPEIRVAALLFLYNFLIMCAFAVVKPVRNALLLQRLGPSWLPYGLIGQPLLTGLAVATSGWFAARTPERNRVLATTLVLTLNLLLFRYLFDAGGDWVALAFYIWAGLFSSVLITQFWLVAGNHFTPREAKRLIGWVGAGGIVGMIVGPLVVFRAVKPLGTENLIYFSSALLLLCLPLVRHLEGRGTTAGAGPTGGVAPGPEGSAVAGLNLFREFRHLKLIALISGVSMVVQAVMDYQFQTVVAGAFASKDDKTAFFAQFFAVLNLASLLFQLLLTRFILIRFGVGVALLLLPIALVLGSVGILVYPTLWAVTLAKLGEGGVRYSIQEATREILYLPLPSAVRSRARPLIEMFGARLFEGAAGLLILVCTALFHVSVEGFSLISIGAISIWLVAVLAVKREYLEVLRNLVSEVPAQSQDRAAEVLDRDTVGMLVENLNGPDEIQVCQTLAMLDIVHDKSGLVPHLTRTMAHPSPMVRAQTLRLLGHAGAGGFIREAEALLRVEDADVRVEAVRYLCGFGGRAAREKVAAFLKDADPRVRTAAVAAVAGSGALGKGEVRAALKDLWKERDAASEGVRAEAALLLGTLNDPAYDDLLMDLLRDPSPVVARAALEGVERTGRRPFVPLVVPYLADERVMLYAQRALRAYGDRVLGTLQDYLDDPEEPEGVRRAIPGCFAAIGTQGAARVLVEALADHQQGLGEVIVEALGEMRNRHPDLAFDGEQVEAALLREAQASLSDQGREPGRRLWMAVELLALIYPVEDVYRAYGGLTSGRRELRANALELLDNLLRPELKRAILPSLEAWALQENRET